MKPKATPLEIELRKLTTSLTRAKNQLTFNTQLRTYGKMAEYFGVKVLDEELKAKPIKVADINIFAEQLKQIITERIRSAYYLYENSPAEKEIISDVEIISGNEIEKFLDEGKQESSYVPKYDDQKATLKYFQEDAARTIWKGMEQGKFAQLLISPTQTGKTFMYGSLITNFFKQGWVQKLGCLAPWPVWIITRATVIEQTESVMRDYFNLPLSKMRILNIEAISRGQFGKYFVKEELVIKGGVEHIIWEWTPLMHPCLVIADECHMFIRPHSLQSAMFMGLTQMPNVYFLFVSATPLSRVSEGKIFACATKKTFKYGLAEVPINDDTWPSFAKMIASPSAPEEHCIAAKERYVEFFKDCIVKTKNIRPKFKAKHQVMPIHFQNQAEADFYNSALNRYYKQKAEIEGNEYLSGGESQMALLAAFTILRHAAEECKVDQLTKFAVQTWDNGYAPFLGLCFKRPITAIIKNLIQKHGWKRDDISVIWGGSKESLDKKKKLAHQIKENDALMEALGKAGIDLGKLGIKLDQLYTKTEEQIAFEKEYRLTEQSREQREEERLRYKFQKSRLLLYSYKSGGVGLSASHEEGYGDKVRPRQGCLSLVYNEKELVQGIGRPHAITSISETLIAFPFYINTIEADVVTKVMQKLRCLRAGTGTGEGWETIITGEHKTVQQEELTDEGANEMIAIEGEH
jgi:hypothetical protein